MLSKPQLARFAHMSGVTDGEFAEKEVVLTYLLQLLTERGFMKRVAFKGGTCLRKMILGGRSRFSTDLDFTSRAAVGDPEAEILDLVEILQAPFHDVQFSLDIGNDKKWRSQEDTSWSIYPTYTHPLGDGFIKFEVSLREVPLLEPVEMPQVTQPYFVQLEFAPAAIPCLHESELIAEKIRAAYQRRKARDIYDLAVFARRPKNEALIRKAVVLKLWNARKGFDPEILGTRLRDAREYDWDDLYQLIPKAERETGETLLSRVRQGFSFLEKLTNLESQVALDSVQRYPGAMNQLVQECRGLASGN